MGSFIREKRIYCGHKYMEVDIIPMETGRGKKSRRKRRKISLPKQKRLNDKNARRYFRQLVHSNFSENDYHITLTYKEVPESPEIAEKELKNYFYRLNYHCKRKGLNPAKYIYITEYRNKEEGKAIRLHHHILLKCDLPREQIEELWKKGKNKNSIGWVNADRLQPDEEGLNALCTYLTKDPKGKKRWTCSRNLEKPEMIKNDWKYSRREIEKAAKLPDDKEYWEKKYPGYALDECKAVYNDMTGWSIYLKMHKKDSPPGTPVFSPAADRRAQNRKAQP